MWFSMIPLVAILFGALAVVAGRRMQTRPVRSTPAGDASFLRTPRGRLLVFVPFTLLLVALWLAFDLSVAILPAVILPIWVSQFADQKELSATDQKRMGRALFALGALFLSLVIIGVVVFSSR